LIEYIRDKIIALTHLKWIMHFGWVRGHAGIEGNELVDKLAKEAALEDGPVVYDKIPREVLVTRVQENGLNMRQRQWTDTGKGAVTKAFFPLVRNRLREKIPIFPEFTVLVTEHGKLRSYLHRFGITDNPMCPCEKEQQQQQQQTADHLIFQCKRLTNQRNNMIKQIKDTGGE
jgi:hypothetical protein